MLLENTSPETQSSTSVVDAHSSTGLPTASETCDALPAAMSVVLWQNKAGKVEAIHETGRLDEALLQRTLGLVSSALATHLPQSCALTSPVPCVVLAEPVMGRANQCLTAVFPCELSEASPTMLEKKMRALQTYANKLAQATVSNEAIDEATLEDAKVGGTEDAATLGDGPTSTSPQVPSWKEICKCLLQRVVADLANLKTRLRLLTIVAAVSCGVALVPVPYQVWCEVTCEPTVSRFVAAPFDSRLESSDVEIGQSVTAGDILAVLDGGDIQAELASAKDAAAQTNQRLLAALASSDHSTAEQERLELTQLQRQIDLLARQQEKLLIRAPINGIIVDGDLSRKQGAPLAVGDVLFEIASIDEVVAEVAVPEYSVNHVDPGASVKVFLDTASSDTIHSTISKIHLRSKIQDQKNVFIAEAFVDNRFGSIRPGMKADASVDAGYRTLGWVLFHRPFEALRRWTGW